MLYRRRRSPIFIIVTHTVAQKHHGIALGVALSIWVTDSNKMMNQLIFDFDDDEDDDDNNNNG